LVDNSGGGTLPEEDRQRLQVPLRRRNRHGFINHIVTTSNNYYGADSNGNGSFEWQQTVKSSYKSEPGPTTGVHYISCLNLEDGSFMGMTSILAGHEVPDLAFMSMRSIPAVY
jgi:hypothetical protein